jgi:hypothetical protein
MKQLIIGVVLGIGLTSAVVLAQSGNSSYDQMLQQEQQFENFNQQNERLQQEQFRNQQLQRQPC